MAETMTAPAALPEHLKDAPRLGFMTPEQVAERLGTSASRLKRLRLEGGGPAFVRLGRGVRYQTRSVLEWEQSLLQTSTSKA